MVAETINPDNWTSLENKYEAKCKTCGENVEVGVRVLWKRGFGIRHEKCEPPQMEEFDIERKTVDKKDWKDYKQYSYIELQSIKNCQCCGISLHGDTFINDERRVCGECFLV